MDTILDDIFKLNMDTYTWHSGDVLENWFALGQSDYEHNRIRYL